MSFKKRILSWIKIYIILITSVTFIPIYASDSSVVRFLKLRRKDRFLRLWKGVLSSGLPYQLSQLVPS